MTAEESIKNLNEFIDHFQTQIKQAQAVNDTAFDIERAERDIQTFDMAIKALEQEPKTDVLDKIRNEIDGIEINGQVDEHTMFIRTGEQVKQIALDIIDKYKAESEDKHISGKDQK